MSAPGGLVLTASAVLCAPMLWMLRDGSISVQDAVVRWLVCVAACYAGISVVAALAFPSTRPAPPDDGSSSTSDSSAPL